MPNKVENNHFIPRALTRPWEHSDRRLWYYDFDADEFCQSSSKRLFAENQINSHAVEAWLNRYIETPFLAVRSKLVAGDLGVLDDWPQYRAALFMVWFQAQRFASVTDGDIRATLDRIARWDESKLDELTVAIREDSRLFFVRTMMNGHNLAPLFMPETGIFAVLLNAQDSAVPFCVGFALPLDPTCALVTVPKKEKIPDLSRLSGSLANYSVGTEAARRVVLHPGLKSSAHSKLRTDLHFMRQMNTGLIEKCNEAHGLLAVLRNLRELAGK